MLALYRPMRLEIRERRLAEKMIKVHEPFHGYMRNAKLVMVPLMVPLEGESRS